MIPMLPFDALPRIGILRVAMDFEGQKQACLALGVWEHQDNRCPFSFTPPNRGAFQVIMLFPDRDAAKGFIDVLQWAMAQLDAGEIMETQIAIAEAEQLIKGSMNGRQ